MNASAVPSSKRIPLHGVLLLDKPAGYSSQGAVTFAKRLLNAPKAGHTGTLDPFATGLLVVCFGDATKFSQDTFEADKSYYATAQLGIATSTGDLEGVVTQTQEVPPLTTAQIEAVLASFLGVQQQMPPMYSALKHQGRPLYAYAREGQTIARTARQITINKLECLSYQPPLLRFKVSCSKGTYIRVLAEDIACALGTIAHLQALQRTEIGNLNLQQAFSLNELQALTPTACRQLIAPMDSLLTPLPAIELPEQEAERFRHGQRLLWQIAIPLVQSEKIQPAVKIYRADTNEFLGTARCTAKNDHYLLEPLRLRTFVPVASETGEDRL